MTYNLEDFKKKCQEDRSLGEFVRFMTDFLNGAFQPTTKENDDMGNASDYLGHIKAPRPSCDRCNDTTRIIVGTYDDGSPVTADCSCFQGKEDPRG